jgi:hypothetical protein
VKSETLLDVASALSSTHCILKQDIVMKHIMEAYDPNIRKIFFKKVLNEPLHCVKVEHPFSLYSFSLTILFVGSLSTPA